MVEVSPVFVVVIFTLRYYYRRFTQRTTYPVAAVAAGDSSEICGGFDALSVYSN